MRLFNCSKNLCLLSLVIIAVSAYPLWAKTSRITLISNTKNEMPKTLSNYFNKITLLGWTQIIPPNGVPPQTNRDIGFATVFLHLENPQETNVKIFLRNIDIRNISDNQLQSFHFSPQEIELKPLENSVIDIHLVNKTGYVGKDRVKAIVTYQIGGEVNVIESEPVAVDRH